MGFSQEREAERLWLEKALLEHIKSGPYPFDWMELYNKAVSQRLPKAATSGRTFASILSDFCGLPGDPVCRVSGAPERFTERKSRLRRAMVVAALDRLVRDCRIEKVDGAELRKRKCRPVKFESTISYRLVGLMDALARASTEPEERAATIAQPL